MDFHEKVINDQKHNTEVTKIPAGLYFFPLYIIRKCYPISICLAVQVTCINILYEKRSEYLT